MPKLKSNQLPAYRLHKQSGQAIVTFNGRDILLGKHGTAASKAEYERVTAEWQAAGRQYVPADRSDLSVMEIMCLYLPHVDTYYRHADGTPTNEADNIRQALRPLKALYGTLAASDFGPLKLEAMQAKMIGMKWSRGYINKNINRIRRMFRWAGGKELVSGSMVHALETVLPLKAGRSDAHETEPVRPVANELVDPILPHVARQVSAMIQVQRLTGARPGEVVKMTTGAIDRTAQPWVYRPGAHKTLHHGHKREIFIGPRAQAVLTPFLRLDPTACLFSPREAEAERHAACEKHRHQPTREAKTHRTLRDRYDRYTYRRAVERGCDLAFPLPDELSRRREGRADGKQGGKWEKTATWKERLGEQWREVKAWRIAHRWHPHQLRHTVGTEIRREFGIEAAACVLGHTCLNVTEIYAEKNVAQAKQIMGQVG